jgi:RHS repeat-associated protein
MSTFQKTKEKLSQCYPLIIIFFLFFALLKTVNAASEIPEVNLSVKPLDLSRIPTTDELMAAGQLGGQLYPTEDIHIENKRSSDPERLKRTKAINISFGKAIQAWNLHEYKRGVELFRDHIKEYPDSPWASEAVLHMGCEARFNGRYNEAEDHFRWVIEANQDNDHIGAKMMLNKAKSRLAVLKVFQSNFKEATEHFQALKQESLTWRDRTYASHWLQRLSKYRANELALLNCGAQALAYVLQKEGRELEAQEVMKHLPNSMNGHSMEALKALAVSYGYAFTGLRLSVTELKEIPLPAVVQISGYNEGDKGHYWVLEKSENDTLKFFDPQSSRRFEQHFDEFSNEWSGNTFVFSDDGTLPGIRLAENEMAQIYGGCCGVQRPESDQGDPEENEGPKSNENDDDPCGSPKWSVNMINMNLFVTDTPLWYNSPVGPPVHISLSYNSQSAIAQNEIFGNKWQFNYGSYLVVDPGGVVTIFMPDGRRDVYMPDGEGNYDGPYQVYNRLIKISENHFELRFPDNTVYVYNIPTGTDSLQPFLVEIKDGYGQRLTLGYNADVHLTTITDALGRSATLTYNTNGLVTRAADPFGRFAAFEYDEDRNLTKITDMGGYWSGLSYNEDAYLTGIENERGRWNFYIEPADGISNSSNHYPAPGDVMWEDYRITVTNPLGGKEEYYYDGYSSLSWYVSPRDYMDYRDENTNNYASNVPKIRYDFTSTSSGQQGEINDISYPGGGSVRYGYDAESGNRITIRDVHGHTTHYAYNDMGSIISVTDAKDVETAMTYADNGVDLLEIRNGLGAITMTYNDAHDVTSFTNRLGHKTVFSYNEYGQLISKTEAKDDLNITTNYEYDDNRRVQQIKKNGEVAERFTYDAVGRIKTHTDSTGLTLAYEYNNLNSVTKITYPDGKFTSYTYSGCCPRVLESLSDRTGRTVHHVYDALERLVRTTNPEGGLTRYEYDPSGNLVSFTDPNSNVTAFEYDADNHLIKKTYADGKSVSFAYDRMGLLIRRTNAREIHTNYAYDENHNLVSVRYSDGTPGVTYHYDNYDRMIRREDGMGAWQFAYNLDSQLVSTDGPWENDTLTYQYDALGRRTGLSPQEGASLSYAYDNLNRLTGIQTGARTYSYAYSDANPLVRSLTRPNGSVTTYQYDTLNRLTEISNKTSSDEIINQYVYAYNQEDMRSGETVSNGNPITSFQNELVTYNYNNVNQLLSSTNPSRAFIYDDDGNMTQGYTPEGYVFTAAYDGENRLSSVEYVDNKGVANRTEYLYSGDSFLAEVKTYQNGSLVKDVRFVRDGLLALQERDGNNGVLREYVWGLNMGGGIGGLLNLRQGGQEYSYLYDGKGNVTALLDNSQAVVAAYTYDTFGNLMSKTGALDQPFKFSTKRYNEKIGLSYYGYRLYSPIVSRWMNKDPLGEEGGINLYGFVKGNPVIWTDSMGLMTCADKCFFEQLKKKFRNKLEEWIKDKIKKALEDQLEKYLRESKCMSEDTLDRIKNIKDAIEKIKDEIDRIKDLRDTKKDLDNCLEKCGRGDSLPIVEFAPVINPVPLPVPLPVPFPVPGIF